MVTILVRDQDAALEFYIKKLDFEKRQDIQIPNTDARWITVAPSNQKEIVIVLRKPHAQDHELLQKALDSEIGKGTLWTFSTSDCKESYEALKKKGVNFPTEPNKQPHGIEAIFEDLDGNRFNLLQID